MHHLPRRPCGSARGAPLKPHHHLKEKPMKPSLLLFAIASSLAAGAASAAAPEFMRSKVLPPTLPFSEAVRVGNIVYLSGQVGIVPGTTKLVEGGITAETRQALQNIKTTLENHGYSMNDLVKCTAMLADIAEWPAFNDVYKTFFSEHFPARSAFGASGLALKARVEIECIAAADK
jgi:reactive intermediate/imine deaminase